MNVSDLMIGKHDGAGSVVTAVYAKNPPHYAVYRTDERVRINFADTDAQAKAQRDALAPLNPICGEINGLIDGWRFSQRASPKGAAKRYDRRVADALTNALQGDVDGALKLLTAVKTDITDERIAWARFQYLIVASSTMLLIALAVWQLIGFSTTPGQWPIAFALAGGVAGAFFSTAIALRGRTILTDLHWQTNAADAVLRIIVGAMAAVMLISLAQLNAINLSMGDVKLSGVNANAWLNALVLAFVAGFSERLIPDLLQKSALGGAAPAVLKAPAGLSPTTQHTTPTAPTGQTDADPGHKPPAPSPAAELPAG